MIYDELRRLLELTVPGERISDLYQVCTSPKSSPVIWSFQETEWTKLLLRWAQEQKVVKAHISKIKEHLIWDGMVPNLIPALNKLRKIKQIKPVSLAISGREPSAFGEFARSLLSICLTPTEEDTIVFMNQLEATAREIQNRYENVARNFGDLVVPESELIEAYDMENLTVVIPYMVRHRIFEHYHGQCFYFYSPQYPAPSTSIIFRINHYKLKMKSLKQLNDDIQNNDSFDKNSVAIKQILGKAGDLYSRLSEQIILLTKDFVVIKETDAANEVPEFLHEAKQILHNLGSNSHRIEKEPPQLNQKREEETAIIADSEQKSVAELKPNHVTTRETIFSKMPSISIYDTMEEEDI